MTIGDRQDDAVWRGEVTGELRHITQSVRDLQRQIHDVQGYLVQELEGHRDYHARNEHRWGLVRWCEMHPFRLVGLLAFGAAVAWLGRDPGAAAAVVRVLADLLR